MGYECGSSWSCYQRRKYRDRPLITALPASLWRLSYSWPGLLVKYGPFRAPRRAGKFGRVARTTRIWLTKTPRDLASANDFSLACCAKVSYYVYFHSSLVCWVCCVYLASISPNTPNIIVTICHSCISFLTFSCFFFDISKNRNIYS